MGMRNFSLLLAAVVCAMIGFIAIWIGIKKRQRAQWLMGSLAPTDGRQWVSGPITEPLTVYMSTTYAYYNGGQSWVLKSSIAFWFGFSSQYLSLKIPGRVLQINLDGALFLPSLNPYRVWARPEIIENSLEAGGWQTTSNASSLNFSPPRGAKLFRRLLPVGTTLAICGYVAEERFSTKMPLLVAVSGEQIAGLHFVSGFFSRSKGGFLTLGILFLFAAMVFSAVALL